MVISTILMLIKQNTDFNYQIQKFKYVHTSTFTFTFEDLLLATHNNGKRLQVLLKHFLVHSFN